MGLRFRRSVKICDGLRLNFGKTGASVTVGSGPFKKTFNTNGNVTTTVGLPGTGIYWTETERRGSRNTRRSSSAQNSESARYRRDDYSVAPSVNDYFADNTSESSTEITPISGTLVPTESYESVPTTTTSSVFLETAQEKQQKTLSIEEIKQIYLYEDTPIDWTELIAGATADDLFMEPAVYDYCVQMAPMILSGNVDAYLEVIEKIQPVDDLALYGGDFEFGTDSPTYIEVEFSAKPERFFQDSSAKSMLEEFISAVAVRVARDLLALLPITKVLVHVEVSRKTVLSVVFDRNKLRSINFRSTTATDIIKGFPGRIANLSSEISNVERMEL